ncbi:MAG: hypothetical protein ACP5T7_03800, partial [bacterium]
YNNMSKAFVYALIIISFLTGCSESNMPTNKQTIRCNLSAISIFPHPNDAGITLSILAIDKSTKGARIIRIGDEVCEGYKLYRILPDGIELKNNDEQIKQIAYAKTDVIAEPAIKLEQANRQAIKKAEQLQKYGIPQTMSHVHGTRENAIVNSFSGTRFTER